MVRDMAKDTGKDTGRDMGKDTGRDTGKDTGKDNQGLRPLCLHVKQIKKIITQEWKNLPCISL